MANYRAVANGNWSALATWQDDSGGSYVASTVLPGASDVVYFNNFTVQINVDVTVSQIRNNSATGVTAGGSGVISASRTVNADLFHSASTTLITISATAPSVVNITGNMPGTSAIGNSRGVNITGTCTVNYVGDIVSSTILAAGTTGIQASTGTLNITGNVTGGALNSFSTVTAGIRASAGTINIVGNVYASTFAGTRDNYGILGAANGTINITGQVYGSTSAISTLNMGINIGGLLILTIVGNINAANGSPAIYGPTSSTTIQLSGDAINSPNGTMAAICPFLFLENINFWEFRKSNLTTNTLYTPGVATGHPATNNVRTGIVYGPTNNLTGTCAVPPANTVSLGVPVDNTVGTAQLDANALAIALDAALTASLTPALTTSLDASLSASLPPAIAPLLWDEAVTNITTPNSIGERLKNCSTVATTGAQIASFNP